MQNNEVKTRKYFTVTDIISNKVIVSDVSAKRVGEIVGLSNITIKRKVRENKILNFKNYKIELTSEIELNSKQEQENLWREWDRVVRKLRKIKWVKA